MAGGLTCRCRCLGRGHGTARLHAAVSVLPANRTKVRAWTRDDLGFGAGGSMDAYSPRRIPGPGRDDKRGGARLATIRHGRGVDESLGVAVNAAIDVVDELAVEVALAELIRSRDSRGQVSALIAGRTSTLGVSAGEIAEIRAEQSTRGRGTLGSVSAGTVSVAGVVKALAYEDLGCAAEDFAVAITDEMIELGQIPIETGENPGHVWCSVLAALCKALDEIEGHTEKTIKDAIKNGIASAVIIVRPYPQKERTVADRLLDFIIDRTAGKLAKAITTAIAAGLGLPHIKLILRVTAALCCRDPDEHPAVFKYCIWPLVEPVMKQEMTAAGAEVIRDNVIGGWQGRRLRSKTRGKNYWDLHV